MAVPTIGVCRNIVVAHVTELFLRVMAAQTFILETHINRLPFGVDVDTHIVAHHVITPLPQELHVLSAHEIFRLHTLLILLGQLRLRLGRRLTKVGPKRHRHEKYKGNYPWNNLAGIMHFLLPPASKVLDAYQGSVDAHPSSRGVKSRRWPLIRAPHRPEPLGPNSS